MRVWRACKKARINDLSGQGAKLRGGRWNLAGVPVLYTSDSHSLAILESLTQFSFENPPDDYFLVEIEFPQAFKIHEVKIKDLPKNWRDYPAPDELKEISQKWLRDARTDVLIVPSAVNIYAKNFVLNVGLPSFGKVKVVKFLPLEFDQRLGKK